MSYKIKNLLLMLGMCCVVLTSCGGNGNADETTRKKVANTEAPETTVEETTAAPVKTVNPDDFFFYAEYEIPSDLRQRAVDNMRAMATYKWVCSTDATVGETFKTWSVNMTYVKGQTYTGLPYGDNKTVINHFERFLVNGELAIETGGWDTFPGNQCVSSCINAIQEVLNIDGSSDKFRPDITPTLGKTVGTYTVSKTQNTTITCSENGTDTMYESYAACKKGDLIIELNNGANHCRMVCEDANVVKLDTGKINFKKSTIKVIEQTNKIETTGDTVSSWRVDKEYTFQELFETGYIPVTFAGYDEPAENPYIALDSEITAESLAKGEMNGSVKSNRPIRYAIYTLTDTSGKVVKTVTVDNKYSLNGLPNRNQAYDLFNGVSNGSYTFTLEVGITNHEEKVATVNFTLAK